MDVAAIKIVRDVIAALDESRFDMSIWATTRIATNLKHDCGTAACIGGWTEAILSDQLQHSSPHAADLLGLDVYQAAALFCPPGYSGGGYSQEAAVLTLDHLIETGEVKWTFPT